MPFETIRINILSPEPFITAKKRSSFISAISSPEELRPTRWGDDPPKNSFDLSNVDDLLKRFESYIGSVVLRRTLVPKWDGTFSFFDRGLQRICVEFSNPKPKLYESIYNWADGIANVLRPEFGVVHLGVLKKGRELMSGWSSVVKQVEYMNGGPGPLCARSYLGNRLVDLIGRKTIASSQLSIHERDWGLILDLAEHPWDVDPGVLKSRQIEVMRILSGSGIFATEDRGLITPGPKWVVLENRVNLGGH